MAEKTEWIYIYSDSLKMKIALDAGSGRVWCEDKTRYSKKEIDIMASGGQTIDPLTHTVKKVFQGEIVESGRTA